MYLADILFSVSSLIHGDLLECRHSVIQQFPIAAVILSGGTINLPLHSPASAAAEPLIPAVLTGFHILSGTVYKGLRRYIIFRKESCRRFPSK